MTEQAPKARETVRTHAMYMPAELRGRINCASCLELIVHAEAYVVSIDCATTGSDTKSQTFYTCSKLCRDATHGALTVQYALTGVKTVETAKDAVSIANGDSAE